MWTAAAPLPVLPEQRRTLESWIRAHNTPQSVVLRARIVLLAADGKANHAIAERLKTTRTTVLLWRERFVKQGPPGLRKVAPGRGREPSIRATTIRQIADQCSLTDHQSELRQPQQPDPNAIAGQRTAPADRGQRLR
jgi:hypothetical protein